MANLKKSAFKKNFQAWRPFRKSSHFGYVVGQNHHNLWINTSKVTYEYVFWTTFSCRKRLWQLELLKLIFWHKKSKFKKIKKIKLLDIYYVDVNIVWSMKILKIGSNLFLMSAMKSKWIEESKSVLIESNG